MTNRHIIDRALPERANLQFYFPNTSEGEDYFVVALPFFENPVIKEAKRARLKKYSLISRSSDLYSYLGADSRTLNLSFNINLAHIMEEHPDVSLEKYLPAKGSFSNPMDEKMRFLKPTKAADAVTSLAARLGTKYTTDLAKDSAQQVLNSDWAASGITYNEYDYLQKTYGITGGGISDTVEKRLLQQYTTGLSEKPQVLQAFAATAALDAFTGMGMAKRTMKNAYATGDNTLKFKIIDIIIYWVNIIRSSVVNNAQNPIYGPPVIRLRHGLMYQDVPFLCTDYSITWNEAMGYDLATLLPRQLQVTMKLNEFRTGDFGTFAPNEIVKRDNLAGWEAVVDGPTNSMDPGYGDDL